DVLGGEARAGAGLAFDHELLAEALPHALAQHARRNVGGRARDEADDDAHRLQRIVLGMHRRSRKRQRKLCRQCAGEHHRASYHRAARHRAAPWPIHVFLPVFAHGGHFFRPAASATVAQRFISLARKPAKSSTLPPTRSMPCGVSALATSSALSASLPARLSLSTISFAVPAGAIRPNHSPLSKPGRPASTMVGRSGATAVRLASVEARATSVPSRTRCSTVEEGENSTWMRPASKSVPACGLPG